MGELWIKTDDLEFTLGHEATLEAYGRSIYIRKMEWVICRIEFRDEWGARAGMQKILDSVAEGRREVRLKDAVATFDSQRMNWRNY